MATKKNIVEAIRSMSNNLPTQSGYVSVQRSIMTISNGHSVMRSDIGEIRSVMRKDLKNGNYK